MYVNPKSILCKSKTKPIFVLKSWCELGKNQNDLKQQSPKSTSLVGGCTNPSETYAKDTLDHVLMGEKKHV